MATRAHAEIAQRFEDDVLAGRIDVGRLFRAAVERQRRDLSRVGDGSFPYLYEPDRGAKVCRFIESFLVHVEGAEDLVGEPLILADFQVWMLVTAFGWVQPGTKRPRFRRVVMFCPKGHGKSTLSGALAAYVLCTDKGASTIVSAATSRDQARLVFDFGRRMLINAPALLERFGVVVEEHVVKRLATGASFKPLSSEARTAEGKLPRLILEDEIHVHRDADLHENLTSMLAKRPDSVMVTISTAGEDATGIGFEVYGEARDVVTGAISDDSLFALLVEADRKKPDGSDADPFDWATIQQANPGLGISIDPAMVKNDAAAARRSPTKRRTFEVKRLGWWSHASSPWLDLDAWDACEDPELDREKFRGEPCYLGLDLANRTDLACKALVFPRTRDDGRSEFVLFLDSYLNEAAVQRVIDEQKNVEYPRWVDEGYIVATPGNVTDLDQIEQDAITDASTYEVTEVCADPTEAQMLLGHLADNGITTVEIKTTFQAMNNPMKELEALVLQKRIRHDGNPVLRWCMGNVEAAMRGEQIRPVKPRNKPEKKIDGAVAVLTAMARAVSGEASGGEVSMYATERVTAV